MDADRLRRIADAQGPFVSLYVDDTRNTADAQKQAQSRWSAIRRHLEDSGLSEHVVGAVERAVLYSRTGVGRKGRAVIAGREGVVLNEPLDNPLPVTHLRVSDYPYLLPLFEFGAFKPPFVFASVDHLGAELSIHSDAGIRTEVVEGQSFQVHKPTTAGWNGYGDLQHTTDEAIRTNVRTIAARITTIVDESQAELVLVCGEVRARTDVASALPRRVADRVVFLPAGARGGRTPEHDVEALIDEELARRAHDARNTVVARFEEERSRASGFAVQGLPAVCSALRDGAVDVLLVGDLGNATVVSGEALTAVAADADSLSEVAEAPRRIALADEALPYVAVATGSTVVRCDAVTALAGGIAALLRYPRPSAQKPRANMSSSARRVG
ncbi:hypothetical protein [Mycolicibacterium iranicum]|uniref:Peptide chain release factor 1 n=1 Tax=Mycolicibacterium iranicum TaxID=912594 RepID=A0A178M0F2_MYCIR|nr:hypothetical protein [Mycolicibacterium iranicum]OAN39883.1 hypothetical protein A4X20_16150 [Mycolicibacterium iranicum]